MHPVDCDVQRKLLIYIPHVVCLLE